MTLDEALNTEIKKKDGSTMYIKDCTDEELKLLKGCTVKIWSEAASLVETYKAGQK